MGFTLECAAKRAAALKNPGPNLENYAGWFLSYNIRN